MKRLDTKSNILKATLPRIRQLHGLEEENRKLKEAAHGMYPDQTTSLLLVPFVRLTVILYLVQAESLSRSIAEAERLQAECQSLKDSESTTRAECESLKDSESAARAELEGMSPIDVVFLFDFAFG